MKHDPFASSPPCGCPSLADAIAAQLAEREIPPCPTHQADEIAAREIAAKRAEIERQAAVTADAIAKVEARWGSEAADANAARREQALTDLGQTDPLLAHLTRVTGADLPLNASATDFARHLGGGFTVDTDPGPLDAA